MNPQSLRRIPLFAGLPDAEIQTLAETLQAYDLQVGDILFEEGSRTESFFIVLDGEVDIVRSHGTPDERVVATRGKDSLLGEMSIFRQERAHSAAVRARTPLKLLRMTLSQFDALLHRHPDLAYDLLRLYSRRLDESENMTIADLHEKNRQLTQAYQELQAAQAAIIAKEKLERELQIAGEMQQSILPGKLPKAARLDFGALMVPSRVVGGDFYDFIQLGKQRTGIVVGDVCDKGMPAALFMALTYSSLRTEALRCSSPGNALRAVNRHLMEMNRSGMFVTLLYGILDHQACRFSYARAGHPSPLLLDGQNCPVEVPFALGQPVGLFDNPAIDEQAILLPPQGTLFVYSDGLSETVEAGENPPSLEEVCRSILAGRSLTAQQLCEQLWRTVGGPDEQSLIQDDFTLVCVKNSTRINTDATD